MGMNSNNTEKFTIEDDGTINRPYNELDTAIRDIIRVASNKNAFLAMYIARRKCYRICKNANKNSYSEYVDVFLLDNYPNAFKKAEYEKKILLLVFLIIVVWSAIISFILMFFYAPFSDGPTPIFLLVGVALTLLIIKKISTEVEKIKNIK